MKPRRVVAALEPQRPPRDSLRGIVELARSMQAELLGLFIEDIELLHFAALPFAREVGAASALARDVDLADMERFMRERAEELRRSLAEALAGGQVGWSFRVGRGTVAGELFAVGKETPGPTLLLPPGSDIEAEPEVVTPAELTESRLRELVRARRPVLIVAAPGARGH